MTRLTIGLLVLALSLSACDSARRNPDAGKDKEDLRKERIGSVFGSEGLLGSGGKEDTPPGGSGSGIAVNSYLWRASLDTVGFFPMAQVDAFGGVITTEWYALPDVPDERYKLNIYILGRELRADGVRVSAFRQVRAADGNWRDAAVAEGTAAKIENAILTRARQMRINTRAQYGG